MVKMFKYSLKIFAALCLVGIVFMIGVVTVVDPNRFKTMIQKQMTEATGQTLAINGPLSWHILPTLSLEVRDLAINTITLKTARFEPRLWSLLTGKLLIDIHMQGLNAHLNQSNKEHSFFESIQKMPIFQAKLNPFSFKMLPYNITLENATIHWKALATNQDLELKNIKLSAKKISVGAVGLHTPLAIDFDLEDATQDLSGHFSVNADWAYNHKTQQLDVQNLAFNTNYSDIPFNALLGSLQVQKLHHNPLIEGDFHIPNLGLQYALSHFDLPVYPVSARNADLTGKFRFQFPSLEVTSFNLVLENEGDLTGNFKANLQGKTLKTLSMVGSFEGKNLRLGTLPVPEIKLSLQAKDGIFIFDQIKAQLASSHHQAKMQIDLRSHMPQFTISDQMDSFEINELLGRLGEKDKIYGNIQAKINLTTQGNTLETCLQYLSGKAYVHLTDGRLRGIDLSPLLRHAQSTVVMLKDALSKRNSVNVGAILTAELGEWRLQAMNVDLLVTPFRHLETNITFDNGRAYTSDFKLTHPEYTVNGHGVVDLIQKNVEYQALALLTHAKQVPSEQLSLFLKETPLAILIKGPFDSLAIQPNLAHYADGAINLVHKESTEKATDHTLEKLFGFP